MTEIRRLQREDVHLEQGVILLPQAKAGARPVILSAAAQKILRATLEAHSGALVFPGPHGRPYSREQIGKAFRKAARASGLRDFRFHDLRHTTARRWRSTRASQRRSLWRSAVGRRSA
jgi:integrase